MRRRLIWRMLAVSVLLIAVLAGVLGGLALAIEAQHAAGERARRSQSVIAGANLAQQRLLAVQTNIRGYLIGRRPQVLTAFRAARRALPAATLDLIGLVEHDRAQVRLAEQVNRLAVAYVDDYADPVIARTRQAGVGAGRAFATASDGSARANEVLEVIERLGAAERVMSARLADDADTATKRALLLAGFGFVVCVAVLGLATAYTGRRIVIPVGRLSAAASRVARGEHDVRVPEHSHDEVGRLGGAFNAMAQALEHSHTELEMQNTELELQAVELEERSAELAEAAEEARAQRDALEDTAAQLAVEKARAERYGALAERLASSSDVGELAAIALEGLCAAAGADVGVLWVEDWRDRARWSRAAVVGLDPDAVPDRCAVGGEGASARAVASRSVVVAEGGAAAGLRVRTGLGTEALVRWEAHVPLRSGERAVGVVVLGGLAGGAFAASETSVLERLAAQTAVALTEASALAHRSWLFRVNAAVLDGVREGIALVGLDHDLVLANAAMERLAERLAMPIPAAIGVSRDGGVSDDPDAYFARWEAMLAEGDQPTADELASSGVVLQRYTAPVDDEAGARIGRLVVLRDVTREREVDRLKSDLMATVSHELRTPLASVLGYAELLRTRRLDDAMRDEIVGTVHREAKRLAALIDDFLDVQAIERKQLVLAREPFAVMDLLREQVQLFSGQSALHRVSLEPCAEDVRAEGDRGRVAQVVANVLSNAIKYSPDGGDVRVTAVCEAGEVEVAVADSGLGIPTSQQPHIFEKFFRVDRGPAARVGGTGLGLALAHEIVSAHGGRMGFESTEGEGSRFWFTLPTA